MRQRNKETASGPYALFELTNALPRAKLFANWTALTNDAEALQLLASKSFDPWKSVIVDTAAPDLAASSNSSADPGTVEITIYEPKRVRLAAAVPPPAVLLLNDKTAPRWRVEVDGRPAALLRCNHIMRGVALTPGGAHGGVQIPAAAGRVLRELKRLAGRDPGRRLDRH